MSVRISKEELRQIETFLRYEKATKSALLRDIVERGIKEKKLAIALEKFRNEEVTVGKAAQLAGIPLTKFLDILKEKSLEFHYTVEELREDVEELV